MRTFLTICSALKTNSLTPTGAKNPDHVPPLLDRRDLFLLESFQVNNGSYESVPEWRARLNLALKYRQRYGAQIFATTTTTEQEPFSAEKFNYAWWTAFLYGLRSEEHTSELQS